MMTRLFSIFVFLVFVSPSWAQSDSDAIKKQISAADSNYLVMKSGRSYTLSNGAVIEEGNFAGEEGIMNIFDFENSFIIHKYKRDRDGQFVTMFSELPPARIEEVRQYGCYIASNVALMSRHQHIKTFNERHCAGAGR